MKIALAQLDPVVGDIASNAARIARAIDQAAAQGADLVVCGELSVVGYPPRDLLRKERFVADSVAAVEALAARCTKTAALVGFVRPTPAQTGRPLQNAAALLAGGKVAHVHVKALLPTYDVFDETRYFQPGGQPGCIDFGGLRLGVSICEDLWDAQSLGRDLYAGDPIGRLRSAGADVIINMAASPYQMGKERLREDLFARQAKRHGVPIVYVNQVGGNDELIFDGTSCVVGADGRVVARAAGFREDLLLFDTQAGCGRIEPLGDEMACLSSALKLGLRDYVTKCGFRKVVLGLSGGIDSAVVATLAADALGGENVCCIAMPSRYSSDHSVSDARALAEHLGVQYVEAPIEPAHAAFETLLGPMLTGGNVEIASENIQARIRGNLVMAMSNAFGHLPLATGNKSELSCGYCTLYGDMCGGLAPIGDVLKTVVYRLAKQLNDEAGLARIPPGSLTKPPSAELKPNQVDQDKLPPYDLLDRILTLYVEEDLSAEQIVSRGLPAETVDRVVRMVDAAEYKRKQAAPVLKVTSRAFGSGRRMPIAQRYVPSGGIR
ncbi:MAG TPA: NAD+ synthase [Phycisphaerae bacterium]|nr:NAD+ synthase [Phycisphaerae bacterium]